MLNLISRWILFCSLFSLQAAETIDCSTSSDFKTLSGIAPIQCDSFLTFDADLEVYFDPPDNFTSITALGVFAWVDADKYPGARIYYDVDTYNPSNQSSFANSTKPYIMLETGFKASRRKYLKMIATYFDIEKNIRYRGPQVNLVYNVESAARPYAYAYLVPGIESGGYFLQYQVEVKATARAQVAGGQEFADFFSEGLRIGPYGSQLKVVDLMFLDGNLTGFEGGFAMNTTDGRYYGILVPYHNGNDFFGKVVRINLKEMMTDAAACQASYVTEWYDDVNGEVMRAGNETGLSATHPCVHVLDLSSLHIYARGFRRGFSGDRYGYLSPGQYSVAVRLDIEDFRLETVRVVDLALIDPSYGGFSGGFSDGSWACFCPFRSFAGPVGGVRSFLPVDAQHLRPYFFSTMVCVNGTIWDLNVTVLGTIDWSNHSRSMDFSTIETSLRGFSDAVRAGRYAYVSPLNSAEHSYSSKLLRIDLGPKDIGTKLASGVRLRDMVDILDLAKINATMAGFSGLFVSGKYLILVPYRNAYEPSNGQRGHGTLTRLDMNDFSVTGVEYIDLPTTTRSQIPSFADANLRGFSYGFASGQYGMLVPFFNAVFNGKIARFLTTGGLATNVQELDLLFAAEPYKNVFKGYRGGFASMWQGVDY